MLLESIINKTINYYKLENVAIIQKKNLDIKFKKISKNNKKVEDAYISEKSTVDYYGIYKGKFIAFEAKSTNQEYIYKHNFKPHQHNYLESIKKHGGISFYIILFKTSQTVYLTPIEAICFNSKSSIHEQEIKKSSEELNIMFPGIIDFLNFIK